MSGNVRRGSGGSERRAAVTTLLLCHTSSNREAVAAGLVYSVLVGWRKSRIVDLDMTPASVLS